MYLFKRDGISIRPVLDMRIENVRRCFPIRICVIYHRKSKYYSTGESSSTYDWARFFVSRRKDLAISRQRVVERFEMIVDITSGLMEQQIFSFDNLKAELFKRTSPSYNLYDSKE